MVKKPHAIYNITKKGTTTIHKTPSYGHHGGEFEWNEATQGVVLGAFYYGYMIFQIFGGRFTELFGAKWILGAAMFVSCFVNLIGPIAARKSVTLFITSRAILGVAQSVIFPSSYGLFCKWIPETERGTFLAMLNVGGSIGIILSSSISGFLCSTDFLDGWPAVFYVTGFYLL
ncbi:membrane transporter-like protein [Dinothrombium tinctorium]|uniref:Membrane transporter-like protein n=1 Tax=Dinothrombium tinctorium TaxID=1965070 RepID=A0A3S3RGP2_9ACAR|nr:membrane transporter-like protein [Dinothrombium tinctorium]